MDTEILKHPDCPFDVIVRNGDALVRYKRTQSMEPANPQIVLMALLIKELMVAQPPQEIVTGLVVDQPIEPITEKTKTLK